MVTVTVTFPVLQVVPVCHWQCNGTASGRGSGAAAFCLCRVLQYRSTTVWEPAGSGSPGTMTTDHKHWHYCNKMDAGRITRRTPGLNSPPPGKERRS